MSFIKVHQGGNPVLINLDNVTEIYAKMGAREGCDIFFNTRHEDEQSRIDTDETLDQIQALIAAKSIAIN